MAYSICLNKGLCLLNAKDILPPICSVEVRPPDVNHSDWDTTLVPDGRGDVAVRLGLRTVTGFPQAAARRLCPLAADSGIRVGARVDSPTERLMLRMCTAMRPRDPVSMGVPNCS